jgi:hypothetical protein
MLEKLVLQYFTMVLGGYFMSTNYLKNFAEGETIRASETNANNQFLLNKISDNASDIQLTVQTQISNVKSELATTKTNLESQLATKFDEGDKATIMDYLMPDYSKAQSFTGSSYTAPKNGYITGGIGANDATRIWYVDGVEVARNADFGVSGTCTSSAFIMIGKGQKWSANASHTIRFIPCKGEA